MSRSSQRTRFWIGGALALAILAACVLLGIGGADRFKRPLEAGATNVLGMPVRIVGHLGIGLFPGPHLSAGECQVLGDSNAVILSVKRARFRLEVRALLTGQLRLRRVELVQPHLFLVRDRERRLNVAPLRKALASLGSLDGARVSVSDATLEYSDLEARATYRALGVDVTVGELHVPRGTGRALPAGLALHAELACRELQTGHLPISGMKLAIAVRSDTVECSPMTLGVLGGQWTGSLEAVFTGAVPGLHLTGRLPGFRVERFPGNGAAKQRLVGSMDFAADVTMRGRTAKELIGSLDGTLSLRGTDLVLEGNDLDRAFARYESSQNFNLVDLGAVLLAGPVGLAATRGYGFAGAFRAAGGQSRIGALVSNWTVERGIARAQDVALATADNRIALHGGLDFVHERFEDMTMAVVDDRGCARLRQAVRGSFRHPVIEKPEALGSLAGPVVQLYKRARNLFPGDHCEPFYTGSVTAPR